ncbi:ABC transporter substrate-binding protein [Sporosarcina sp. FSL K6-3457]|uniref:ABC transporter substrate-binding protein n=1 Tax=Sporosarcina sp. FSL K6-3457 TaxID=2978204 RepID=UPI0030FBE1D7
MNKKMKNISIIILLIFTLVMTACGNSSVNNNNEAEEKPVTKPEVEVVQEPTEHEITDMAGRKVTLSTNIEKVVLVGSVPVLSSFLLAVGEGDKIVSGLPESFAKQNRWEYLPKFAPNLASKPKMQTESSDPNIEEILKADPDVIFTMSEDMISTFENNNLRVVFLSWKEPEDVKKTIKLVGEIFNKQEKAQEYTEYFDNSIEKVTSIVKDLSEEEKVKVLNMNVKNLSQPHAIAEWWIKQAGGLSVTEDGSNLETQNFSIEQFLDWDPEVLIVSNPSDIVELNTDGRYKNITAVKDQRIYSTPLGAHIWANRTSEQPLMVMFAAKQFYPELFKDLDVVQEMIDFYGKFYGYTLTKEEAEEILAGK